MIKLVWHMAAGGTGAKEGKHSYSAHGWFGEFHIWPPSAGGRGFRGRGYTLQWANSTGLPVRHTQGLWSDLGSHRSPAAAKTAAREYVEKHLLEYGPQAHARAAATRMKAGLTQKCHHCKEPIEGEPSILHTPGKADEHYHPHHLKHRRGGPGAKL